MNLKQIQKMSDNDLMIRVAELGGWERGPKEDIKIAGLGILAAKGMCWHKKEEEDNWQDNPPDFPNDLNAMHKVEEKYLRTAVMRARYQENLCEVLRKEYPKWTCTTYWFATARQRAEAFVLTMEEKRHEN